MSEYMAAKMDDQITGAVSENESLRAEVATLRAALAERQAAIDEIVACKDATDALSIRHGGEWYTASYANEAKAVTDRKDAIWPALRALATKEPVDIGSYAQSVGWDSGLATKEPQP